MTEHHRRLPLPEDAKLKGSPMAAQRHASRVELVRCYIHNPKAWPEGIDWPNWKEPHEIWFTGSELYWIPLAIQAQGKKDAEWHLKQKGAATSASPRRRPLIPEKPAETEAARLKVTNAFLKTAERLMQEAKARDEAKERDKARDAKKPDHTPTSKADVTPREARPKSKKINRPRVGRPKAEERGRVPSASAIRKRRQRERLVAGKLDVSGDVADGASSGSEIEDRNGESA